LAGTAATVLLAGCGTTPTGIRPAPAAGATRRTAPPDDGRVVRYGAHPDQYAVLRTPAGTARGLVVLLHGGFWSAAYGQELMEPLTADLVGRGHATWNVEYRRIGSGGGFPATFIDVATAIDRVGGLGLDPALPVTVLGHSAGGHLAAWAASRNDRTPGGPPRVTATTTLSLSGVLCLATADRERLGGGAAAALMGGHAADTPAAYDLADPERLVPARGRLEVVHARDDQVVPRGQSTGYVSADDAAGGSARLAIVPGDHFSLIDPTSTAWEQSRTLIEEVRATAPAGS